METYHLDKDFIRTKQMNGMNNDKYCYLYVRVIKFITAI